MRHFQILLFASFFLLITHACNGQSDTTNQRVRGAKNGYWVRHRWNGQMKSEGFYVKGEKTGYWKLYDKAGTFHEEGKLEDGKKVGSWYLVETKTGTKLDMTKWDGKGNRVGGATLSW